MGVSIRMKTERDDEEQRAARTHIVLSTNCCIVDSSTLLTHDPSFLKSGGH